MAFYLSERSRERLSGVHPHLIEIVERAITITRVDFTVLEGLRTRERQAELLEAGATTTMNSRHLTGHAVDLGAWVKGEVRWDWPLYHKIADAMQRAARDLGYQLESGANWSRFPDGPHHQLPWVNYPA